MSFKGTTSLSKLQLSLIPYKIFICGYWYTYLYSLRNTRIKFYVNCTGQYELFLICKREF